jgi:hypothetical protein
MQKIVEFRDVFYDESSVSPALSYESFHDHDGPVDSDFSPSASDMEPIALPLYRQLLDLHGGQNCW